MPQDPHITAPEVVRDAVVRSRDQVVGIAGLRVPDLPPPAASGASTPLGLKLEGMPLIWLHDGGGIEFAHHVVLRGANVEVEPPVDVVVMDLADARVFYGREPETRADGSIIMEAPAADVPIPARFHLAYHDDLLPFAVYGDTEEIARISIRFEDGLRGRWAPPDSRSDIHPIRLDHAFLELPVAVGAAGVALVLDVEDRGVGLEEHEFATIHYVAKLDAGSVHPRGCGRPDHEEVPQRSTTSGDRNLILASRILRSGALARIGQPTGSGGRPGSLGSPVLESRHRPVNHVHANDLVAEFTTLGEKTHSDGSLHTAIRQFRIHKRRHGAVGNQPLRADRRTQITVLAQDPCGFVELFLIWQRLVTRLGDLDRCSGVIETPGRQHYSIVGVVVGGGAVAVRRHGVVSFALERGFKQFEPEQPISCPAQVLL